VFRCSVIALETEGITAAGSACFATPPTWRSPTVNVQFRAGTYGVTYMACTKAFELPSTPLLAAQPPLCYGMNEIRYLKSHSSAVLIAEPAHNLQETGL